MIKNTFTLAILLGILGGLPATSRSAQVRFTQTDKTVSLSNGLVQFSFDRQRGLYRIFNLRTHTLCLENAHIALNDMRSDAAGITHTVTLHALYDGLGKGQTLLIQSQVPNGPTLLLAAGIYAQRGVVCLNLGLDNTTTRPIQVRRLVPLAEASSVWSL